MPTIRVDDDIYEALRSLGKTGDSFSDVLRPILGINRTDARVGSSLAIASGAEDEIVHDLVDSGGDDKVLGEFAEVISRHLPKHWCDSPKRGTQILFVVSEFFKQPTDLSTAVRHINAAKLVAERFGVKVTTVHDKCGRQLYGTGTADLIEHFRRALELIEVDWREHRKLT